MRTPNRQSCSVAISLQFSIVNVGSAVWRCESLFKHAIESGESVFFEFDEAEVLTLASFYEDQVSVDELIGRFLNSVILTHNKMPFRVRTVRQRPGTDQFICQLVTEEIISDLFASWCSKHGFVTK